MENAAGVRVCFRDCCKERNVTDLEPMRVVVVDDNPLITGDDIKERMREAWDVGVDDFLMKACPRRSARPLAW